jgi:hypothetical protein
VSANIIMPGIAVLIKSNFRLILANMVDYDFSSPVFMPFLIISINIAGYLAIPPLKCLRVRVWRKLSIKFLIAHFS